MPIMLDSYVLRTRIMVSIIVTALIYDLVRLAYLISLLIPLLPTYLLIIPPNPPPLISDGKFCFVFRNRLL